MLIVATKSILIVQIKMKQIAIVTTALGRRVTRSRKVY